MNMVIMCGRCADEVKVRYTTGNKPLAIAKFTIAVDDFVKGEKVADFHQITVFGRSAENCERFLEKGKQVLIQGRLKKSSYEKDGKTTYFTDIIADKVEFIGSGKKVAENESLGDSRTNENTGSQDNSAPSGFMAIPEGDIPF